MPATFKDAALEQEQNAKKGHYNGVGNDVDDTKEWEGVYPNKLDAEM